MTIRLATEEDIPAIVDLLKLTLGERLMPKSEQFWRWKHVDNPFGVSPVLLAIGDNRIVGVRAFMRWEWGNGQETYKAVRAVDTATHPDYQGRGIFRKLTLQLVEQCRERGDSFVFNTPNGKSKPGYLKMGWRTAGRCRVKVRPRIFSGGANGRADRYELTAIGNLENLIKRQNQRHVGGVHTVYSAEYVRWRYMNCPNVRYHAVTDNATTSSFAVIFRMKPHSFGNEMRVCDILADESTDKRAIREQLLEAAGSFRAAFVSFAGADHLSPFDVPSLPIGPEVTILPLNTKSVIPFDRWRPTLGDLEVF